MEPPTTPYFLGFNVVRLNDDTLRIIVSDPLGQLQEVQYVCVFGGSYEPPEETELDIDVNDLIYGQDAPYYDCALTDLLLDESMKYLGARLVLQDGTLTDYSATVTINRNSGGQDSPPEDGGNQPPDGSGTPETWTPRGSNYSSNPLGRPMRMEMTWNYIRDGVSTARVHGTQSSFTGINDLSSVALDNIAMARGQALQKVFPEDVLIRDVTVKQRSDNGNRVADIGYTRTIPLNLRGAYLLTGKKTTSDEFKAKWIRTGPFGRPGFIELSECMTTDEVKAWQDAGTIPARFEATPNGGAPPAGGFILAMQQVSTMGGAQEVFEKNVGGFAGTYRNIAKLRFAKIDIETAPNFKPSEAARFEAGIQAQLNSYARSIKRAQGKYISGQMPAGVSAAVASLRSEAQAYMATIPAINRAHVNVDPILYA